MAEQQQEHEQQHVQEEKQIKLNPWGNNKKNDIKHDSDSATIRATKASTRSTLQSIMKEQEEEKGDFSKKEEEIMKDVDDDEAMRLAVEASLLYEIASRKMETSEITDKEEEFDDDLKLAMELSLNDVKVIESASTNDNDNDNRNEEVCNNEKECMKECAPLKDDPKYANYFLMKNVMNVDIKDIKQLMKIDGADEKILDLDPNKSLNDQSHQKNKKNVVVDVDSSYEIALQLQREEDQYFAMNQQQMKISSNNDDKLKSVRTVSKYEFELQKQGQKIDSTYPRQIINDSNNEMNNLKNDDDYDNYDDDDDYEHNDSGFRLNNNANTKGTTSWKRHSPHSIIGPNGEIRTKHDVQLKHISNAQRLSYHEKNYDKATTSVSDNAYNSLNQKLKRYTNKGVATHGHGKSELYNDKTRGGVMDASVRLILQKAINNNMITQVNGVISEGKEAVVYHGDKNVAIKVFKRIQEFRNRGEYVDGDVRYYDKPFSKVDKRQQVELWAEKEYRNLIRANRAFIPSPKPKYQKQNVIIMSFLGTEQDDGSCAWPAPKLKDIQLKFGSSKWIHFYCLIMVYIKKLYHCANLIHADLSEYNILIVPSSQIKFDSKMTENKDNPQEEDTLSVAFIDFGQSVDCASHPKAMEYLKRDIDRIQHFFHKVGGVSILLLDDILSFIMSFDYDEEEEGEEEDDDWEFTSNINASEHSKIGKEQCNPNEIDDNNDGNDDEYILISKEEQEAQPNNTADIKESNVAENNDKEKNNSSTIRKGCFRKLNKWNDEFEYEYILKKVVV